MVWGRSRLRAGHICSEGVGRRVKLNSSAAMANPTSRKQFRFRSSSVSRILCNSSKFHSSVVLAHNKVESVRNFYDVFNSSVSTMRENSD